MWLDFFSNSLTQIADIYSQDSISKLTKSLATFNTLDPNSRICLKSKLLLDPQINPTNLVNKF